MYIYIYIHIMYIYIYSIYTHIYIYKYNQRKVLLLPTITMSWVNPAFHGLPGVLRPVGRLLGRLALRGAVALHVSVLRHVPALLRGMADGAVALGNLLGDVLGVTAQAKQLPLEDHPAE